MTISIRPATRDDIPTILRFVRDLAAFERAPDAVEATEAMLDHALFGERSAEALIAERAGEAVAFALFFHNFSTWTGRKGLYLEDLYVTPAARGSGVGTALLRHLAGIALDRDCGRFEWSVLDWNQPAIDFYTGVGAEMMQEWRIERVVGAALGGSRIGRPRRDDRLVFTSLGFHPVTPGSGQYVIGRPFVERAVINLPSGKRFTVQADDLSDTNRYVGRVLLDGKPLDRTYITHNEIERGGTLRFVMRATPNRVWATKPAARPYSMTGYTEINR